MGVPLKYIVPKNLWIRVKEASIFLPVTSTRTQKKKVLSKKSVKMNKYSAERTGRKRVA
jgi:hypothetical protein